MPDRGARTRPDRALGKIPITRDVAVPRAGGPTSLLGALGPSSRALTAVIAAVTLRCWSSLFIVIAVLIKLTSPGPILYCRRDWLAAAVDTRWTEPYDRARATWVAGIRDLQFRSMYVDADLARAQSGRREEIRASHRLAVSCGSAGSTSCHSSSTSLICDINIVGPASRASGISKTAQRHSRLPYPSARQPHHRLGADQPVPGSVPR